jgi:glycerol kinase
MLPNVNKFAIFCICFLHSNFLNKGMTENKLLMQMQADVLGIPVIRQSMTETTSFGAALAAGHAIGLWNLNDEQTIPIIFETYQSSISQESELMLII